MGKAGRPRLPQHLKIARGTHRPDRDAIQLEIDPGIPEKPDWLGPQASEEWDKIVSEIAPMGIMGLADRALLIQYCSAWQEWHEANEGIKKEGMTCIAQSGASYQNPLVGIRHKAADMINKLGQQFGLSPAARTNLKPPEAKKADTGKAKFFEKHG